MVHARTKAQLAGYYCTGIEKLFSGIPAGGEFPEDVHLPTVQILKKLVPGDLVDGPIAAKTYDSLRVCT
jgi:hypothetical protein